MADGAALPAAAGPSWVGETLNGGGRWTVRSRIPLLLGFMMLFDSWDSVVIAYTLPSIAAEWKLSALQAGWLISAGYGGQFLGAILFGALAERRGRVPVLRLLVLVMGLLALLCAVAEGYEQLMVLRLVQGLAIGGGLPVATCYINEIAPTATRGRFYGSFQFLMVSGFGIAALSSAWLIPQFGWRIMFALGALPLVTIPLLYVIPESPRWLAARGRSREAARALERLGSAPSPRLTEGPDVAVPAPRASAAELLAPGMRRQSGVMAALWFLTALVSFGLVTWIPSLYVSMFKIPLADALAYNSIAALSVFVLPILLRQSIDRIGRRPPVILGTGIGGLALLALVAVPLDARALLVGLSVLGQIGISIGSMVLWPYTAEIYPTRIRSVALGSFASLARGASMLTPLVVGGLLELTGSVTPIFWIFGLVSIAVSLLWLLCTQETAGRDIDA